MVGMADGFAQASGRPTLVNLHTAPGVGNAMGAIFNAQANKSPLVITAGQQVRAHDHLAGQPDQPRRDAAAASVREVELRAAPRAEDVPAALGARDAPGDAAAARARCSSRSRWTTGTPRSTTATRGARSSARVGGRAVADPEAVAIARRAARGAPSNPVLVVGPDVDASGAWEAAVALAERQRLPVWATPAPGGGRIGFPEGHPNFRGMLPPAIGPLGETLAGHDLVLVVGASVFPYYPYIPGPLLPEGTALVQITSDPDEAARAPMGDAIVADVRLDAGGAAGRGRASPTDRPPSRSAPPEAPPESDPLSPSAVHATLAEVFPEDGIVVLESPPRARWRCATSCGSRSPAATTSAPAAASASGSPPRSACSSRSRAGRSSA